jgi:hypothetical protein
MFRTRCWKNENLQNGSSLTNRFISPVVEIAEFSYPKLKNRNNIRIYWVGDCPNFSCRLEVEEAWNWPKLGEKFELPKKVLLLKNCRYGEYSIFWILTIGFCYSHVQPSPGGEIFTWSWPYFEGFENYINPNIFWKNHRSTTLVITRIYSNLMSDFWRFSLIQEKLWTVWEKCHIEFEDLYNNQYRGNGWIP